MCGHLKIIMAIVLACVLGCRAGLLFFFVLVGQSSNKRLFKMIGQQGTRINQEVLISNTRFLSNLKVILSSLHINLELKKI